MKSSCYSQWSGAGILVACIVERGNGGGDRLNNQTPIACLPAQREELEVLEQIFPDEISVLVEVAASFEDTSAAPAGLFYHICPAHPRFFCSRNLICYGQRFSFSPHAPFILLAIIYLYVHICMYIRFMCISFTLCPRPSNCVLLFLLLFSVFLSSRRRNSCVHASH